MTLKKSQSSDPEADTLVLGLDHSKCLAEECEELLVEPEKAVALSPRFLREMTDSLDPDRH